MSQVYEGLMRHDPVTKKIVPALAKSYSVSPDGKTYTFHLRKGVYFHDDPAFENHQGREVKAEDIVFCFTKLCEKSPHNQLYAFVIDLIKGAREHYESGESGPVEGVRALDEYTVQFELEYPAATFLSVLTHPCGWIFPRELYTYENAIDSWCIGTGPFEARTIKMNEVVILERNKNYWRKDKYGNQLPYLDAVRCNYVDGKTKQVKLLKNGSLDLILEVPFDKVKELKHNAEMNPDEVNYEIISVPGLRVEYYAFQNRSDLFSNELARKAINYAINRQFLVDSIFLGYATPATHGFVPPAMAGYPIDSVKGYTYQPMKAKALFAKAGYENGKGFPVLTLQLNDGSNAAIEVAAAVQDMLSDCLNITTEIAVLPRNRHYDAVESGTVNFWRDGWIGDYADPENFLRLFYGKLVPADSVRSSYLNTMRFIDPEFDKYFEQSLQELDPDERMSDYWHADQEIINRAAVVPLYYEDWLWLANENVNNLEATAIGILDLSRVYFAADTTTDLD